MPDRLRRRWRSHSNNNNTAVSDSAEPYVAELDRRPRLWHESVTLSLTTSHHADNYRDSPPFLISAFVLSSCFTCFLCTTFNQFFFVFGRLVANNRSTLIVSTGFFCHRRTTLTSSFDLFLGLDTNPTTESFLFHSLFYLFLLLLSSLPPPSTHHITYPGDEIHLMSRQTGSSVQCPGA